jgi:hypothetical protein
MASKEILDFLTHRYLQWKLLPKNPAAAAYWDPYIYPGEGNIPFCSVCKESYENFKSINKAQECIVEMAHGHSCLWQPYFAERIRRLNPHAKVIVKRNQGRGAGQQGRKN